MFLRFVLLAAACLPLAAAPHWVLIRTTDGKTIEGETAVRTIAMEGAGKAGALRIEEVLSVHSGAPASASEGARITEGLAAIQGADRKARDLAVEELTAIGIPVMTPLLEAYKDTDQHEPRPLYRLFERIMPSGADGLDRTLSLVRLKSGAMLRGKLPAGAIAIKTAGGKSESVDWAAVRTLAVRQTSVARSTAVHSLKHCTQIEYLDTGVVLSSGSKLSLTASGFTRLSWNTDGWATDPNGLQKPGPNYKTNLVNGHPFGALVGRVGAAGEMVFLGKSAEKTGLAAGRLFLAVNDNNHWQNNLGTYSVSLTATNAYDLGAAQ